MSDRIEVTENQTGSHVERERHAARRAVEAWSDMRSNGMSDCQKAQSRQMNEEGFLDFTMNDPLLIAKVDATLDRGSGKLTFTEMDGNQKHKAGDKLTVDVKSGNLQYSIPDGQGADGRYDNVIDHGPIPKGDYMIGNRYRNGDIERQHPGGDPYWYRLYGKDGKGGYDYKKIWNGRGGFNLHTGDQSNGCVGTPSQIKEPNPGYPYSAKYNQVKDFIDSTKPFEYKGTMFKGWLHVK